MSVSKPIDDICRKLAAGEEPGTKQILVRADKDGEVLNGIAARIKTAHRFSIRSDHRIEAGTSVIRVRDFANDANLDIPIRWTASLQGKGRALIRASVQSQQSVQHTIEATMQKCLQSAVEKRGDLELGSWVHNQTEALKSVVEDGLQTVGLESVCVLETAKFVVNSLEIKTPSFVVRTKDSARETSVSIDMRIDPMVNQAQTNKKKLSDWDVQIRDWVKDYVERNEALNNLYKDDGLEKRIEKYLASQLKKTGWQIQRFLFKTPNLKQEESLSKNFKVNWTSVKNQNFEFDVKLSLVIEDLGMYDKNGRPSLEEFAQNLLDNSFETVLFEKDTDSLSPDNFKDVREDVHEKMSSEARKNGVRITTLVADPAIQEWELLKHRIYNIEARDYETSDPGSKANFSITLNGRISSIGEAFLATRQNETVEKQIENIATERAAVVMREVEISDYINHFLEPAEVGMQSLKSILCEAIEDELQSRFKFDTHEISVHQNDPGMRQDLRDLQNDEVREANVQIMPDLGSAFIGDDYLIPMVVRWRFDAPSRENAVNLIKRDLNLSGLAKEIPAKIKSVLNGLSQQELSAVSVEERSDLKNLIQRGLNADLGSHGVAVQIESVLSGNSKASVLDYKVNKGGELEAIRKILKLQELADKQDEAMAEASMQGIISTYNALIERRNKMIAESGTLEHQVKQAIEEIEQKHPRLKLGHASPSKNQSSSSVDAGSGSALDEADSSGRYSSE